jgi:excisionase family DNA binding protein
VTLTLADVQQLPVVLTVEETAQLLGIGRRQAYEAVQRGQIPAHRFGHRWVVPTARLLAMLGLEHDEGAPEGAPVD